MSSATAGPARSALVLAARRAVDAEMPRPLVHDPYARLLTTDEHFRFAASERDALHYVLLRHRRLDDFFAGHGHTHAVVLGAGLDTKSLRHSHVQTVEVDREAMVRFKRERLEQSGLALPRAIAHDIVRPADLRAVLAHLPAGCRGAVVAEGFFMYHPAEWLLEAIEVVSEAARPPNLGFDLLRGSGRSR